MKSIAFLALAGALISFNQVCATAQVPISPPQRLRPVPATVKSGKTLTFVSQFNHEAYKIDVYIPKGAPPPGGYPALYVLDGDIAFATFADAVRNKSKAKEIEAAVVIGISSADGPNGGNRTYDFTYIDMSPYEKSFVVDAGDHPRFGGYDQFFRMVQEEVKPMVNRLVPLNPKRASLLGWSLGGLFVLHTMFAHPDSFHGYISLSPSIWWDNKAVLAEFPDFQRRIFEGTIDLNLFLGVGALEEEFLPSMEKWGYDNDKFRQEMSYDHMVQNAQNLATVVAPYFEETKLRFASKIFEGQTHNSVPWSAVNPVLDFEYSLIDADTQGR